MSITDVLSAEYAALCVVPPLAKTSWFQRRGYRFEQFLYRLLAADDLEPRTSYKASGEQIDGSFFLDGSVLLIEAKWHAEPIPASVLYQFKGKIDGKLSGTLGVFISMSGYSKDAVDALTLGKTLNVVLFDKRDIDAAVLRKMGFKAILKRKLRYAAEEGVVYLPSEVDVVTAKGTRHDSVLGDERGGILGNRPGDGDSGALIIVCEGNTDREIITRLVERILSGRALNRSVSVVVAMGKYSLPKVANAVRTLNRGIGQGLVVVDSDGHPAATREMLLQTINWETWTASLPDPDISSWLGLGHGEMQFRSGAVPPVKAYKEAIDQLDIEGLRQSDASFAVFYNTIVGNK